MVLQKYQNLTEMTSNMIYIVAFGVVLKCPCKIHLNTQCKGRGANPTLPPPPSGSTGPVLFRVGTVSPPVPLEWSHQSKIFPPSCPLSSVLLSEILVAGHIVLHLSLGGSFVYELRFALDFLNFLNKLPYTRHYNPFLILLQNFLV